jgi:DNA sulfur modification protein DndD
VLFKELIIKDFLSFKGVNKIIFPKVDTNESSIVLVLAANNSGKTNILKALRFLLYGHLADLDHEKYKLINSSARNEDNSVILAFVEATIGVDNEFITFRRVINAIKTSNGYKVEGIVLESVVHNPTGDKFSIDGGSIQRKIEMLVPKELFDYFYFQGEELAKQLMEGTNRRDISNGIFELLHLDDWKRAAENVATVKEKYLIAFNAMESISKEYGRVKDTYAIFLAKQEKANNNLNEELSSKKQAEVDFDNISYKLVQISQGRPNQQRTDLLRKYQSEQQSNNREIDNLDMKIFKTIGDSKGVVFLSSAFDSVGVVLKKMKEENLLPADISDGFVDRLLQKEICICGRPLHADVDQDARSRVEEYRNRSLSEELNSGLLKLLNNLETNYQYGYLKKIAGVKESLRVLISNREKCIARQYDLIQNINELVKELSDPRLGEIAELVKKQREQLRKKEEIQNKIEQLHNELAIYKKKLAELSAELKKLSSDPHMREAQTLHDCYLYANNLEEMLKRSIESLRTSFHEIMQSSVKGYYDEVVTDDTKASIHKESLLPSVISPQGEIVKNIGGGQRQLLVITHIIALCQLRKELHRQLNEFDIFVGKIDDQSFFFDSIFAPTDDVYSKNIAKLLHGKARQVLLLLASQQWHDNIRDVLEPQIDKVYRILLNTTKTDLPEKDYIVKFKNTKIPLVNIISDNQHGHIAFSNIEEIK